MKNIIIVEDSYDIKQIDFKQNVHDQNEIFTLNFGSHLILEEMNIQHKIGESLLSMEDKTKVFDTAISLRKWYEKHPHLKELEFKGKKTTLYSFRHSYAIRRITITNGNIYDVMRDMGHSNPQTTMGYLRFPEQRRLDDFPSLKEYISNSQNMQKNTIRATNLRATIYDNINKLSVSPR